MNFKKVLFISILVLFLSVAAVSAADLDNNCTTESSAAGGSLVIGDSILGSSEIQSSKAPYPYTATFDDLQVEIDNAAPGSVLTLNRNYCGAYGSIIRLDKDLTIDGQGHTLDCLKAKKCSAFYSSKGNIVLKNIKLINGYHDYGNTGGAIRIDSSAQYTIENCIFDNNYAKYGGAIFNGYKPLTIINCTFNSNKADDGGAIYSYGTINIIDSVLTGNTAFVDGGAIYAENNIDVKNCLFKSNRVESAAVSCCGGAIYADILKIHSSKFDENYADNYGGAVYARNIFVYSDNGTFSSFFIKNKAGKDKGGAIYASESITIIDSVLTGNTALVDGGAMYADENVNVKHCLFESNRVEGSKLRCFGGAIRTGYHLTVYNSTFNNNYAENAGGAVYANIVTLHPNCYFNGNTARDYGGAIYANKFDEDIKHATFIGNTAKKDHGGAVYIIEGRSSEIFPGLMRKQNSIMFLKCAFINNTCNGNGGAIYWGSEDILYLKLNFFINNKAHEGQSVYNKGTYGEISNNWWSKNPQKSNDVLIEWKFFKSNVHHTDSNPLKMQLSFSSSKKGIQNAALHFIKSNGQIVSGELYDLNLIKFYSPDGNVSFTHKTVYPYGASTDFTINTPAAESVTISAEIYGITVSKTCAKSTIPAYVYDITQTMLSIASSKTTYYADESITITGKLVDENSNPLTSKKIKIYCGDTLLDTLTTDSKGGYSKTIVGLPVGVYTFKVQYDGDDDYEASASSNLNIIVNHVCSLSISSDKQIILTTGSVTISGQLLKDGVGYGSQTVVLYDGETIIGILTTDGSGNFSKTISGLSVGTHTFKVVHSNGESSTISITVNEPTATYNSSNIQQHKQ